MVKKFNIASAVVVNSGDSNGYGVVANLGMHNIPVLSVDSNPENITFYSRYSRKIICPDYLVSENNFIDFLINLGKSLNPKPVLFVTGDLQLLVVLKHKKKLEDYYHMPMPSLDIAKKLVDKVSFYSILDKFKLPHATTYVPESLAEAEALSERLVYPYIIKPVQSKLFSKNLGINAWKPIPKKIL